MKADPEKLAEFLFGAGIGYLPCGHFDWVAVGVFADADAFAEQLVHELLAAHLVAAGFAHLRQAMLGQDSTHAQRDRVRVALLREGIVGEEKAAISGSLSAFVVAVAGDRFRNCFWRLMPGHKKDGRFDFASA